MPRRIFLLFLMAFLAACCSNNSSGQVSPIFANVPPSPDDIQFANQSTREESQDQKPVTKPQASSKSKQ